MRKSGAYILQFLIIVLCLFCIGQSDRFQQFFSPDKYWQKRCEELRASVKSDECKTKSLILCLDREKMLLQHDLSHVGELSTVTGKDEKEIREKIINEGEKKILELKKELRLLASKKEEREKSFQEAKNHQSQPQETSLMRFTHFFKK